MLDSSMFVVPSDGRGSRQRWAALEDRTEQVTDGSAADATCATRTRCASKFFVLVALSETTASG
jgi:hypothetical protein